MGTTGYTYADLLVFDPDDVILEVGSGDSTWHLASLGPPVVTIDADPDAIARVAGLPAVEAHQGRAEDVLAGWDRPIGFAWLDGYDWPYSGNPAGYYAEQRAAYQRRGQPHTQEASRRSHLAVAQLIAGYARVIAFDDTWRTHAYRLQWGVEGCVETVPPATLPAPRLSMDTPSGGLTCGLEKSHPHHDDPWRGWNGKGGTAIPYLLACGFVVVECELGLVVLRRTTNAAVASPEPSEQRSLLRPPAGPHSEPEGRFVADGWDDEDSGDDELPVSWFRPVVDVPTGGKL